MANSKVFVAILFILTSLLLLGVVDAKDDCEEGLSWVATDCLGPRGTIAGIECVNACQERHGLDAKAFCKSTAPVLPGKVCWCTWPC
ncbi:hypothetical protein ACS0TY_007562 [Phlomoides rotata]